MLTLKNVSKIVAVKGGEKCLVEDVNLIIRPADFIGIAGNNGSGKSVLLSILSANDPNYVGEYSVDGIDLTKFTKKQKQELLQYRYGYCKSGCVFNENKTVLANLKSLSKKKGKNFADVKQEYDALMREFDVSTDVLNSKVKLLSSGTRNILELMFILATKPSIMCLDGPTDQLDDVTRERLINKLVEFNKERETTIIVATADQDLLSKVKRNFAINAGKIVEGGKIIKKKPETVVVKKKSAVKSIPKKIIVPTKKEETEDEEVREEIVPLKDAVISEDAAIEKEPVVEAKPAKKVAVKSDKKKTTAKTKVSDEDTKSAPTALQQQMDIVVGLDREVEKKDEKEVSKTKSKSKQASTSKIKQASKTEKAEKEGADESSEFLIKPVMNKSQRARRKMN